ncbi:hypothetical protein HX109_16055 [Galbibacter sp. BG1]|uniref:hypothetical protein n=1 Tax=Galbibacter sp. BG1 TaxID=1170699 RepID=UPI0015BCC3D9|nr:hypothetical protein [Galbibacter sp. BG1]QLE03009.1 hypothetical protein HX109_16055 [Galbibacter sp. BG1]
MKKKKNIIAHFFLLAFLFIQACSLHGFTHEDDHNTIQDCTWCHVSLFNHLTPTIQTADVYEILFVPIFEDTNILKEYHYTHSAKPLGAIIYNRPPPSFYTV